MVRLNKLQPKKEKGKSGKKAIQEQYNHNKYICIYKGKKKKKKKERKKEKSVKVET